MSETEVQELVTKLAAARVARDGDAFGALWHADGVLQDPPVDRTLAALQRRNFLQAPRRRSCDSARMSDLVPAHVCSGRERRREWPPPRRAGREAMMQNDDDSRAGWALFDSAIGLCGVAWSAHGIVRIQLPEATRAATVARLAVNGTTERRPPAAVARAVRQIVRHLAGDLQDLSGLPLDMSALPPFGRAVYAAARAVPAGRTATYGELARRIAAPGAARAIGRTLGGNPFPIVVPCHRVLAANGKPGGFSAFGGVATKAKLLEIEGVTLSPSRAAPATKPSRRAAATASGGEHEAALRHLRAADAKLGALIERVGACGLAVKQTHSVFEALAEAIVYQQLHGKAAATIFGRFRALFPGRRFPGPAEVLAMPDEPLRAAGLSRNKLLAIRDLAAKAESGVVPSLAKLRRLGDDEIIARLTTVRGIGRWTVEMLLMFRLGRPDVLPVDDYGVRKGFAVAFRKKEMPPPAELARHGERWRPYRSVASWYLWRAAEGATQAR